MTSPTKYKYFQIF